MQLPDLSALDPTTRARVIKSFSFSNTLATVTACKLCPLHLRRAPIPAEGSASSLLAIISPNPSLFDEQTGRPLSGRERAFLSDSLLEKTGISLEKSTIIHAMSCRPNTPQERTNYQPVCTSNLTKQIDACGARVILILGEDAMKSFLPTTPYESARGKGWFDLHLRAYFVTDHPSNPLKNPTQRTAWDSDIAFLAELTHFKLVEEAAKQFRSNNDWPEIINDTLNGLDPYSARDKKHRFLADVIKTTGRDPVAIVQANAACSNDGLGLFDDEIP